MLDGLGVLYAARDQVTEVLVPFARSRGSLTSDDDIRAAYLKCTLGRLSSSELWKSIGLRDDAYRLDNSYVRMRSLSAGATMFLRSMVRQGFRIACISNDVGMWAHRSRRLYGLDEFVSDWTISAMVGDRKPSQVIYRHFEQSTGVSLHECWVVDDRVVNLDSARHLGAATILFRGTPAVRDSRGHDSAQTFRDLQKIVAGDAGSRPWVSAFRRQTDDR